MSPIQDRCMHCSGAYHGSAPCWTSIVVAAQPIKYGVTIPVTDEQLQEAADQQLHDRLRSIGLDSDTAWKAVRIFRRSA